MTSTQLLILLLIGLFGGFVSGSMGVGGGIIIIPALVFFLGASQQEAQGTSIALLSIPVAMVSAYNYYKGGYINFKFVATILVTFLIGSYFGSKLAVYLPANYLKKGFALLLILVGFKMMLGK